MNKRQKTHYKYCRRCEKAYKTYHKYAQVCENCSKRNYCTHKKYRKN